MSKLAKRLGLLALLLVSACATPISLPPEFVALGDQGEGYRAISSDDARVWVREMYDATPGELEFWAGNLERDFVAERGYELLDKGVVENRAHQEGRWLEFSTNVRGKRVDYLLALWVHDPWWWFTSGKWIQVVEFAAGHDVYAERVAAVRAALATVR